MGFRKHPLKRRDLIALLEHNGFVVKRQAGTSHRRYMGTIDGRMCLVDVDMAIDDFHPNSNAVLWFIVTRQLGFGTGSSAWKRFYAGHPDKARQHGLAHKRW